MGEKNWVLFRKKQISLSLLLPSHATTVTVTRYKGFDATGTVFYEYCLTVLWNTYYLSLKQLDILLLKAVHQKSHVFFWFVPSQQLFFSPNWNAELTPLTVSQKSVSSRCLSPPPPYQDSYQTMSENQA